MALPDCARVNIFLENCGNDGGIMWRVCPGLGINTELEMRDGVQFSKALFFASSLYHKSDTGDTG